MDSFESDQSKDDGKRVPPKGLNGNCAFCKRPIKDRDDLKFGPRESSGKFTVHYFCMLLSTRLLQQGDDEEGIKGFLEVDIYKELRRARKYKCCYCSVKGATVTCAKSSCRRIFHFPCGFDAGAVPDFSSESFNVFCADHVRRQKIAPLLKDDGTAECLVCLESIRIDLGRPLPADLLVSPCCRQLYEKGCLRGYAKVAGMHHFKCSQCRNEGDFLYACRQNGIFVPDQDAEWERNDEFADHYVPHNTCDVPACLCPAGRASVEDHDDWEVVRCDDCGKSGTHIRCSNLTEGPMSPYKCNDCELIAPPPEPADAVPATRAYAQEEGDGVVPHSSIASSTRDTSNIRWYQKSRLHKAFANEAIIALQKESVDEIVDVDDSCIMNVAVNGNDKESQRAEEKSLVIFSATRGDHGSENDGDRDLLDMDISARSIETPPRENPTEPYSVFEPATPPKSPSRALRQLTLERFASPTKPSTALVAATDRRKVDTNSNNSGHLLASSTLGSPFRTSGRLLALTYPSYGASPPKKRIRRRKLQKGQTTLDNYFRSPVKISTSPIKSEACPDDERGPATVRMPILDWLCRGLSFRSNDVKQEGPSTARKIMVKTEPADSAS